MFHFLEWWAGLGLKGQLAIAGSFLLLSTIFLLNGRIWIWGWVVGVVLLLFSGSHRVGDL